MTAFSRFTPSTMPGNLLEDILVSRHAMLDRMMEKIIDSADMGETHHMLLIGPRGIGKTHTISILHHRLVNHKKLQQKLMIAWLREEEWGVTSFLDLVLAILRTLVEQGCADEEKLARIYEFGGDAAEQMALQALEEVVGEKKLLLLMENLNDIFESMGEDEQKRWRAYVQENPYWITVATAQAQFGGISRRASPFYGYFSITHLNDFNLEEAIELLSNLAKAKKNFKLVKFLRTPTGRARIRAVHQLAGGNPRIYVIFSKFLSEQSLNELIEATMQMLDDLTPYYQSRMTRLSPLQQKVVSWICNQAGEVTVKEITEGCMSKSQTISSTLKTLRELGYVAYRKEGRESYYDLSEPLMRITLGMKKARGKPIRIIIEFLRFWYTTAELEAKLRSDRLQEIDIALIEEALSLSKSKEDPRVQVCLKELDRLIKAKDVEGVLNTIEELRTIWIELNRMDRFFQREIGFDSVVEKQSSSSAFRGVKYLYTFKKVSAP